MVHYLISLGSLKEVGVRMAAKHIGHFSIRGATRT